MSFIWTFLEGVISFVSPCMLPLLPVYVAYFAADGDGPRQKMVRAFAFVCGFSIVFILLGVFAGSLGAALSAHRVAVDTVCGSAVALFGLSYLGLFRLPFSGTTGGRKLQSVPAAFLFGLVYSVNLTPCVGAFLGAALMQAASEGGAWKGASLLAAYSCGLGVPFVASAALLGRFTGAFGFVKRNYRVINPICGGLLVAFGVWMVAQAWMKPSASVKTETPQVVETAETKALEVELTATNFEREVLQSERPVLVDFWAPWCGPCRKLGPLVAEIAREKAAVLKVGKANVDETGELAARYGVNGIPALFVFKGGKIVASSVGYCDKATLLALVEPHIKSKEN